MKRKEALEKKRLEAEKRIENKVQAILFPSFLDLRFQDNPYLALKDVNKIYDNNVQAVFDFNLFVNKEEFIVFVGPSGCGKSTTLRMICGLEEITSGGLFIDGTYSNDLSPKDRDIAMVFQSYALYPHMTVADNLAFSLKIRKIPVEVKDKDGNTVYWIDKNEINKHVRRNKELAIVIKEAEADISELEKNASSVSESYFAEMMEYCKERISLAKQEIEKHNAKIEELKNNKVVKYVYRHIPRNVIDQKVEEVAKTLEIDHFLKRKPKALSGGQRQRVALGRAIIRDAKVFLMDEPLSNLDAKLRVQMRSELVSLHRRLHATTVYVTHDQTEAMTMADRIVVMKDGVIQQTGSPKEIYNNPSNLFVATFIGAPSMNILDANYADGKVSLGEVSFNCDKASIVKEFYEKEVNRMTSIRDTLSKALQDSNKNNQVVYTKALEKADSLITMYNEKLNGNFNVKLGIRPEDIYISSEKDSLCKVKVELLELLGSEYYVHASINGQRIVFKASCDENINIGDEVAINFRLDKSHLFDSLTEQAIY